MTWLDLFYYNPGVYLTFWKQEIQLQDAAMMTSSNGNIFRVTGHNKGQWHRAFIVYLFWALNIRLSKQSRGWWFETPSRPSWRHCHGAGHSMKRPIYAWYLLYIYIYINLVNIFYDILSTSHIFSREIAFGSGRVESVQNLWSNYKIPWKSLRDQNRIALWRIRNCHPNGNWGS